jgi:hypothetical protein
LREHSDQLYGAILSYEGKPGDYQIAEHRRAKRELDDVTKEFEQLNAKDLPAVNDALKAKGPLTIAYVPTETPSALFGGDFCGDARLGDAQDSAQPLPVASLQARCATSERHPQWSATRPAVPHGVEF